ncbi:hypothetical protein [Gordonia polyisoprenivorans]|uniref:hypothetical protein n=1 Tax=Gordonia polyisoprenivorans TaxID=84595 RepID=UPI001AD6DB1D|nr:hypothetical protein [Gordonia polyisoprenivorans]QTI68362.1 hypothetical protein J6U32_23170 [Gordonia polyisoprenivorans]
MPDAPQPVPWAEIVTRYRDGANLPSMPGARTLQVTGADDEYIYVTHRLWSDKLTRANIEKAMDLIAEGKITRVYADVVDYYRTYIADERPTTAATVLKDLGFVE